LGGSFSIDSICAKTNWRNFTTKPNISAENFLIFKPKSDKDAISSVNPINSEDNIVVRKAEELLAQNINEGNGKELPITQGRVEQWCADTVNYIYEKATGKTPFGLHEDGTYKSGVKELMQWGIDHQCYNEAHGEAQIQKQLETMKPGDVIIWKSSYAVKIDGGGQITRKASHTGIVKEVKDGMVSIIEGNANIRKKNEKGECLLVHNDKEGDNGSQAIGDFQEVNRYDGIILNQYSTKDLIDHGYSGYIDMQKLK